MRKHQSIPGKAIPILILLVAVAAHLPGVARAEYREQVVSDLAGGYVHGTVHIDRKVEPVPLQVTYHRDGCGEPVKRGGILADDERRVRDVAVFIDRVEAGAPLPTEPVLLDQRECMFEPRMIALAAGQPLVVRNSDGVFHSVMTWLGEKLLFHLAFPIRDQELWRRPLLVGEEPLERGRVRFTNPVHPWMEAFAIVREHPYVGTTDSEGYFRLGNLLPGTYELVFWHPVLGDHRESVTIREGEGLRMDVVLPVP